MGTHPRQFLFTIFLFLSLTACTANPAAPPEALSAPKPPYLDENGWTVVPVQMDTRVIYVSSSQGSDSNSGRSPDKPVKSLRKAFSSMREGYPDHVLLKRGDVWVDENLNDVKSGRSDAQPALVGFYGDSGPRPKLKTTHRTLSAKELHNVHFDGLDIEAYKLNPDDKAFDGETSANIRMVGNFSNIEFHDLRLRFVEFIFQGFRGGMARDIRIRRSIVLDKYSPNTSYNRDSRPSGLYTDHGDGLTIEETVWDHNGWNARVPGAGANMYNHNIYISQSGNVGNRIILRHNIITRGSSLGVHGRPGGLYENNFFARNAIGLQMGYRRADPLKSGTIAYALNNVISEGVNMKRGVDACSAEGRRICTAAIWGIQVENLGEADARVEGNIVANRDFSDDGSVSAIKQDDNARYKNNIVYRWESEQQGTDQNYPDPDRTLATYHKSLGGKATFDAFMEKVRNRGLREWDSRYTASAINDYFRAGFNPAKPTPKPDTRL